MSYDKTHELEERVVSFTIRVIKMTEDMLEKMPYTILCDQLTDKILKSSIAVSLNYAVARSAESREDFIHIMKLGLKELREIYVCLKIIENTANKSYKNDAGLIKEANELISIFVASIKTAHNRKVA